MNTTTVETVPIQQDKEFLTTVELAKWLGVSLRTIANLRTRHILPYVKLGRVVRFRRAQVEIVLRAHTVQGIGFGAEK